MTKTKMKSKIVAVCRELGYSIGVPPPGGVTLSFLVRQSGVPLDTLLACDLSPADLAELGASSPAQLAAIGLDSLHLMARPTFTRQLIERCGVASVREAFAVSPADALNLSATSVAAELDLDTEDLFRLCKGRPTEATAVLKTLHTLWLTQTMVLGGVQVCATSFLLTTDASVLKETGMDWETVQSVLGPAGLAAASLCRTDFV